MRIIRNSGKLLAVTAALFLVAVPATAQDDDEGPITQGDDAKYLHIYYVKFKPGQRETAMEIISGHKSTHTRDSFPERQMGRGIFLGTWRWNGRP